MIDYSLTSMIITGVLLGAGSGITPGPLNALIISESLKSGKNAGIKVAITPLITDVLVIIISMIILGELAQINSFLTILTFIGGAFITYLGIRDLFLTPSLKLNSENSGNPFIKGIITNIFTPHPFIFWITIGAPILKKSSEISVINSISFIIGFYLLLVGFKVALALFTGKIRRFFEGKRYIVTIKVLGALLILLGVLLFYEGFATFFG